MMIEYILMISNKKGLALIYRIFDFLLLPFMWILGGFKDELPQETHAWHTYFLSKESINPNKLLFVKLKDIEAKFGHNSPLGLYHMPIFGGLTKYAIIEVKDFVKYWNVGWPTTNGYQMHKLRIYNSTLKLLCGKSGIKVFAINNRGVLIKPKIVGYGTLGDGKYKNVRLF